MGEIEMDGAERECACAGARDSERVWVLRARACLRRALEWEFRNIVNSPFHAVQHSKLAHTMSHGLFSLGFRFLQFWPLALPARRTYSGARWTVDAMRELRRFRSSSNVLTDTRANRNRQRGRKRGSANTCVRHVTSFELGKENGTELPRWNLNCFCLCNNGNYFNGFLLFRLQAKARVNRAFSALAPISSRN